MARMRELVKICFSSCGPADPAPGRMWHPPAVALLVAYYLRVAGYERCLHYFIAQKPHPEKWSRPSAQLLRRTTLVPTTFFQNRVRVTEGVVNQLTGSWLPSMDFQLCIVDAYGHMWLRAADQGNGEDWRCIAVHDAGKVTTGRPLAASQSSGSQEAVPFTMPRSVPVVPIAQLTAVR